MKPQFIMSSCNCTQIQTQWENTSDTTLGDIGSGGKSYLLAVGGLPGRVEMSLSKTPNPQLLLTSWLVLDVNVWIRSINCTALWIRALYKFWPFTVYNQDLIEPDASKSTGIKPEVLFNLLGTGKFLILSTSFSTIATTTRWEYIRVAELMRFALHFISVHSTAPVTLCFRHNQGGYQI